MEVSPRKEKYTVFHNEKGLMYSREGRTRLPTFKFSAKFTIGLQAFLQLQIKKKSELD